MGEYGVGEENHTHTHTHAHAHTHTHTQADAEEVCTILQEVFQLVYTEATVQLLNDSINAGEKGAEPRTTSLKNSQKPSKGIYYGTSLITFSHVECLCALPHPPIPHPPSPPPIPHPPPPFHRAQATATRVTRCGRERRRGRGRG